MRAASFTTCERPTWKSGRLTHTHTQSISFYLSFHAERGRPQLSVRRRTDGQKGGRAGRYEGKKTGKKVERTGDQVALSSVRELKLQQESGNKRIRCLSWRAARASINLSEPRKGEINLAPTERRSCFGQPRPQSRAERAGRALGANWRRSGADNNNYDSQLAAGSAPA